MDVREVNGFRSNSASINKKEFSSVSSISRPHVCECPGEFHIYMKKTSVVNGTEAAIIMGCAKSNVINISDKLGWEYERRGNSKYYRLCDVCGHAGCTQKEGLRRVAELRASKGQPSDVKIEFPGVSK